MEPLDPAAPLLPPLPLPLDPTAPLPLPLPVDDPLLPDEPLVDPLPPPVPELDPDELVPLSGGGEGRPDVQPRRASAPSGAK
jgi:hypothetical protein